MDWRFSDALFCSSCSSSLSCCLFSFAHFANWSWLLVALSSSRTRRYSFWAFLFSTASLDDSRGNRFNMLHSCDKLLISNTAAKHTASVKLQHRELRRVGGRTRPLMAAAPTLFTITVNSSTAKMTRMRVGDMVAGVRGPGLGGC